MAEEAFTLSDWIEFARFEARQLRVADPVTFGDLPPAPTFDVQAGLYLAQVRVITYASGSGAHSIRVVLSGARTRRADCIGEAFVDFGMLSIFDWPTYEQQMTDRTDDEYSAVSKQLEKFPTIHGTVRLPDGAAMPVVGDFGGDGGFSIFELLDDAGERVGVEVDLSID